MGNRNDTKEDVFVHQTAISKHMQYHKSREQNKNLWVCVYCDNKPFNLSVSLKCHLLIHENAKPFQCTECQKTFCLKSALKAHESVHSGIRFSCHCGKLFITRSLLTQSTEKSLNSTRAGSITRARSRTKTCW